MRPVRALQLILALSVFGMVFSGVLSYRELFGESALSCPAPGAPGTVFGYPACIYGFFMYLAMSVLAVAGLYGVRKAGRRKVHGTELGMTARGV